MTLDSSRTHRSDPEGLIQSYVLRVEEKNRLAESEWKKIEEAKKAKALADEKAAKRKEEWDRTGFYRYQNAASKRIAQQRMDWFSQQQKENEKRLSLQHAQSAAPTRSSTGGMPRDAEAAGRCADWVQQLDEQPFVPARRRRYLKLEHTPKAPKPVPVMRKVWPSNVFRREEEQGAAEKPRSASAASLQAASGGRGEERASRTGGSTRSLRSEGSRGRIISAGLSRPLIY
uniref:Uncharacterized protein n=1 Tax=Guillardia theta TaxID=55529 RepID=A0A7S4PBP9_GUITH|mmetsp:Transcript_47371/g.148159  ORF Transcript_47371/g.148159 Transcript_47371/m.148159 type:complete len:230 (+) Transcript_47371:225-914(+)